MSTEALAFWRCILAVIALAATMGFSTDMGHVLPMPINVLLYVAAALFFVAAVYNCCAMLGVDLLVLLGLRR